MTGSVIFFPILAAWLELILDPIFRRIELQFMTVYL